MKKNHYRILLVILGLLYLQYGFSQQSLYDPDSITIIQLTFTEGNWDAILDTYKSNSDYAERNCNHDYEDERLLAHCVINGVSFDSVGVKYKGNSTYNENSSKNPLNIKLDHIKDQDYKGYSTLKLSNNNMDPAFVREVMSYDILREYMDAPKSNFAKVYINGNYYGLFSSSESINKRFARKKFDYTNTHALVKGNAANTMGGDQPSLMYINNDTSSYMCSYQMKSDYGWYELLNLISVMKNDPSHIENVLDIDRAIWMLAFNNITCNFDSYTGMFKQNYYLIYDKNKRICPVIWDLNMCFGAFTMTGSGGGFPWGGGGNLAETELFLHQNDDGWPLIKLVLSNERYKKMYVAHCRTIMEEYIDNNEYKNMANYYQNLVGSHLVQNVDNTSYNTISQNIESNVSNTIGIAELMSARRNYLNTVSEFVASQPYITITSAPDTVEAFTTIKVTANIQNASYAYLGFRHSADEIFTKIPMSNVGGSSWEASFPVDEKNTHYYIYAENNNAGAFSPQRAEHEYHRVYAKVKSVMTREVVINELMASNTASITDEAGEYNDWVEIYNTTSSPIELLGYYLTDNIKEPAKWAFPDTTIPANGYLIVWADEDGRQGPMHANFKLSSIGETLAIVNSDYAIVDSVTFGAQWMDEAYARVPNGTGNFTIQDMTFEANNEKEPEPITQTLNFTRGWNLFSLYLDPVDNNVASLFANIDFSIIKTPSSFHKKGSEEFLQGFNQFEPGQGYLIYVNNPNYVSIEGFPVAEGFSSEINEGWNLIGVPVTENRGIDIVTSLPGFELIKNFEGYNNAQDFSSLQELEPGKAYYLKINSNTTLQW